MKKSLYKLSALALASAVVVTGCSSGNKSDDKATEKKGGEEKLAAKQVVNLTETSDISIMDPGLSKDAVSSMVLNNTMDGLYRLDKDNKPIPAIAESHEVSPDGKKYTFKIREGAKWSNGDAVTAKDFEYAWKRALDPKTAAEYAFILFDIKNAEKANKKEVGLDQVGIKAKDDKTLEVELERPVNYFLNLTAFTTFFPLNQKFVESQGDKYGLEPSQALYNGPFVMSEWKHEQGWKLKKNDQYWDKKEVKLEELNFSIVKDTGTNVNLYEAKQVDRARLTAEFVDKYKNNKDVKVIEEASVYYLKMNQNNKVLKNQKARAAITHAMDKAAMTNTLLNNGSQPADYLVPKKFAFSDDAKTKNFRDINGDFVKFDAKEAEKLWKEALKELGTDKVTISLLNYDTESAKKTGEYIKDQLEKHLPGLTLDIKMQPFPQKLKLESAMDYDITYAGWKPDFADPITFLDMFTTGNTQNQMNYSNKKFDELIAKTRDEKDNEKRYKYMAEAEKILLKDDAAISPIYQRGTTMLQRTNIKNEHYHQTGGEFTWKWAYVTE